MSEQELEFWKQVYVASIIRGCDQYRAVVLSDEAVDALSQKAKTVIKPIKSMI